MFGRLPVGWPSVSDNSFLTVSSLNRFISRQIEANFVAALGRVNFLPHSANSLFLAINFFSVQLIPEFDTRVFFNFGGRYPERLNGLISFFVGQQE